jgi:hypothetical protein
MKNINIVLSIVVIAFIAAELAVVPSLQEANANELTLLKNSNEKNFKHKGGHHQNHDYIIDEQVIKLVKNETDEKPKKPN